MKRILCVLFLCSASVIIIPNTGYCDETALNAANKSLAKKLFLEGGELFANEKYLAAADVFRRAYEIAPTWKLLFNLAQAEAAGKRYGLAIEEFERYLSEAGDDIDVKRSQIVMAEIQRLRMLVGVLEVDAPDGTTVLVDNVVRGTVPFGGPTRVAVGEHQVRLVKDGEVLLERSIWVAGEMTTSVTVDDANQLPAPGKNDSDAVQRGVAGADGADITPTSSPAVRISSKNTYPSPSKKCLVLGLAGSAVGLAGITVGVVFTKKFVNDNDAWETALADYNAATIKTMPMYNAAQSHYDDALRDRKWLIAGYIAGGLGVVAGTILLLKYGKEKRKHRLSFDPANGLHILF